MNIWGVHMYFIALFIHFDSSIILASWSMKIIGQKVTYVDANEWRDGRDIYSLQILETLHIFKTNYLSEFNKS